MYCTFKNTKIWKIENTDNTWLEVKKLQTKFYGPRLQQTSCKTTKEMSKHSKTNYDQIQTAQRAHKFQKNHIFDLF